MLGHGASIVRDGLVLHLDAANPKSYPGSGTVWKDLSGLGNNGTLVNGVGYSANNNGAMVFDGVNDYTSTSNIPITNKLTVCGFVSISSNRAWQTIVGNWNSTGSGDSWLLLSSDGSSIACPSFFVRNSLNTGGSELKSSVSVQLNTYNYISGVFDDGNMYIYLNGNPTGSKLNVGFTSLYQNSLNIWAGRFAVYYSTGSIAQTTIYNRALSATEIRQNFEALRGRYGI